MTDQMTSQRRDYLDSLDREQREAVQRAARRTLKTVTRGALDVSVARTAGDPYTDDHGSVTGYRRCILCGRAVDPARADWIIQEYDVADPSAMSQTEYLRHYPDGPLMGPSGVCHREGECGSGGAS